MKTAISAESPDGVKLTAHHFLQITTGGLMDFSALVSAVGGAKTAVELVKTAIAARDQAKAEEAITDVKRNLSTAYDSLLAVSQQSLELVQKLATAQEKIQSLEKEKNSLQSEIEERDRYVLADIGRGVIAYVLKEGDQRGDTPHRLCQPCMTKGHKSVLQPYGRHSKVKCHACDATYETDENAFPAIRGPSSPTPYY